MKNYIFFKKFFESLSTARKINFVIFASIAVVLSLSIAIVWGKGGCEFTICALGALIGFLFPAVIGKSIDDVLVK